MQVDNEFVKLSDFPELFLNTITAESLAVKQCELT